MDIEKSRQHGEAVRKGLLANKDEKRASDVEKSVSKLAKENVKRPNISRSEKILREYEENMRNRELRSKKEQSGPEDAANAIKLDYELRGLADFMGLDTKYLEDWGNELNVLLGWAKENSKNDDLIEIFKTIHGLKKDLGLNIIGKKSIKYLYKYIRLDADGQNTSK